MELQNVCTRLLNTSIALVNLVSRLTKSAPPGTILVTQPAADALAADAWNLEALEPRTVSGLDDPVSVFAVTSAGR